MKILTMKNLITLTLSFFTLSVVYSQSVKIGTQEWMTKNLDVDTFRNGDPIPQIQDKVEWTIAGEKSQPAWCYFENDPEKGNKFGKLYNWYALNDPRGLAQKGWHVPTDAEWTTLTNLLGGSLVAGGAMKSTTDWDETDIATNSSGFTGLPGGYRTNYGGFGLKTSGCWWSSKEESSIRTGQATNYAYNRSIWYRSANVSRKLEHKAYGFSVRLVRD